MAKIMDDLKKTFFTTLSERDEKNAQIQQKKVNIKKSAKNKMMESISSKSTKKKSSKKGKKKSSKKKK